MLTLTLTQAVPMAGAVIVNAANSGAVGFRQGLKMFQQMQIPVLGIVENMSYFIPPDMPDKRYDILGLAAVKRQLKNWVPLLGCVPLEISLRGGGDHGIPLS